MPDGCPGGTRQAVTVRAFGAKEGGYLQDVRMGGMDRKRGLPFHRTDDAVALSVTSKSCPTFFANMAHQTTQGMAQAIDCLFLFLVFFLKQNKLLR